MEERNNKTHNLMHRPVQHAFCEQPKVSIIVPVYDAERYLVQCLNSITNQTLEALEIILVHQGDADRCGEIVDYFASKDPRIIAHHQQHAGYGTACNLGIQTARGEYLAIVEPEDFIEPEMYEEMHAYAKALDADVLKAPFFEFVAGEERRDCGFRKFMREQMPQNQCFSMKEYGDLLHVHPSLWSGIYKTSYLHEHGIQFPQFGQAKEEAYLDLVFRVQTLVSTDRVAWVDRPYYNHRSNREYGGGIPVEKFLLAQTLERWREIHAYFRDRQADYEQYYGPHLILEEYFTTFHWVFNMDFAPQEWEKLKQNISCTPETAIAHSPALNRDQKRELLAFKKNPEKAIEIMKNIKHQIDLDTYGHLPMEGRFCFPWKEAKKGETVVLYGGGIVGKTFLRQLLITQYCRVAAICDAHPERTGIPSHRIPVLAWKKLLALDESSYDRIVIANERKDIADNIRKKMLEAGLPAAKIAWADPVVRTSFDPDED